ncbi:hypothetical protein HDV03_003139 [Kappamyces sp. JEL0829]|nr:hypothetical protein HDV03_003139 [Kappamyces sp. JEL0829]
MEKLDAGFLLQDNDEIVGCEEFRQVLLNHHPALFKLFATLVPISSSADELEIRRVFTDWINFITLDQRISYTFVGFFVHAYCTWWACSRVHLLPVVTLGFAGSAAAQARPWTLVDVTGCYQALYYLCLWIPNRTLNQHLWYYGSQFMTFFLWTAWFLVDGQTQWLLDQTQPTYGRWNAVYTPLLYWLVFSVLFSRSIGLAAIVIDAEREQAADRTVTRSLGGTTRDLLQTLNVKYAGLFMYACPMLCVLYYWTYRPAVGFREYGTDLVEWPSYLYLVFVCITVNVLAWVWRTFLTFQIQFVVWDSDWSSGIVVLLHEKELNVGIVY